MSATTITSAAPDQIDAKGLNKTRYAIAGLSSRGINQFLLPLLGKHESASCNQASAKAQVVGVYDIDAERFEAFCKKYDCHLKHYSEADGIEGMLRDCKPDVLLVTGPDHTHCEHVLAGLKHNLRVIVEKPLVIDSDEVKRVLQAERESKGSVVVAHNVRYGAAHRKLKELILEGKVGRITNVEYVYNLDTNHGASYFYRWNRERRYSGGLSIHKSVHHIDFINWLLADIPETVFSFGALNYYGPKGALRPRSADGSPLNMEDTLRSCPYYQRHHANGKSGEDVPTPLRGRGNGLPNSVQYPKPNYIYDGEIDIEDTYACVMRYSRGALLSYSINFSTPQEGYRLGINGTAGRLEIERFSQPQKDGSVLPANKKDVIHYYPLFGGHERYEIIPEEGGHGGSDPILRSDLFDRPGELARKLGLVATAYQSGIAVAAGEAMWRSAVDGKPWKLADLLGADYSQPD